ncbi:helicase-related protein, partial [Pseudomonas aeruginosa]|uniref:helicase-related protein n=1 Tax=Pseudomonas aeruginosa TaxID=287 RepID=UPI001F49EF69
VTKSAIRPGSNFNRQGGSIFHQRQQIAEFEAKSGFNILIMSPVAAGVGLTVIGANHVVHLERHWNPAKEAQASDRVYRIGQTKPVFIHLPAVTHPQFDSFDVHLDRLLRGKLMLKDAVVTPEAVSESEMIQSMGLMLARRRSLAQPAKPA